MDVIGARSRRADGTGTSVGASVLGRAHRALRTRRPEIRALMLIQATGVLEMLAVFLDPVSRREPVGLVVVTGSGSATIAVLLYLFADRIGVRALVATTGLAIAGISVTVAAAHTVTGALLAAFRYLWIAVYGASFLPRKAVFGLLVLLPMGCAVALGLNGLPDAVLNWILVSATAWVTAAVLQRALTRLRAEAETDELTGLANRRGFVRGAELARALAGRVGAPVTLVVLDLDGFKAVNDAAGHVAGDRLLVEVAAAWRAELRAGDLIGRFGGDEFVLLLPTADEPAAAALLRRLRRAHDIAWTAGVATWQSGEDLDACLERADAHLYANRDASRNGG